MMASMEAHAPDNERKNIDGDSKYPGQRAPRSYVEKMYDGFGNDDYDTKKVENRSYDGHLRLRRAFNTAFGGEENVPKLKNVVDAGCGTGLVGEQFRNISSMQVCVDISSVMLQKANELRPTVYDQFLKGDIIEFVPQMKPVNLILAGDVFTYFGDLDPLFKAMSEGMADTDDGEAYLAFTCDNIDFKTELDFDIKELEWKWQLVESGRFKHQKEYVIQTGQKYDLEVIHYESIDGYEILNGEDVRGHLFVMQKMKKKATTTKPITATTNDNNIQSGEL